jgi:hypothetical protein
MEITYRKADIRDIDFIIDCITEAEKSGTAIIANAEIFGYSETEYRQVLRKILEEDVPGSEYCCDSFFLALDTEQPVGGFAMWLEGEGSQSSNMLKASLLSFIVGVDKWKKAQPVLSLISSVMIPRSPNTFQIDAGYVIPPYRGMRISPMMNHFAIRYYMKKYPEILKIQTSCIIENEKSIKTLQHAGFVITKQSHSDNPEIKNYIPGTGFCQLEMEVKLLSILIR